MGYLTDAHNQKAVYWGNPTPDGYGGNTFDDPVEVDCRWEERNDMFRDAYGQEKVAHSVVFLGQDVDVGGYLFLGDLDDIASDETPESTDGALEIQAFRKIPDIDFPDEFERKAFL